MGTITAQPDRKDIAEFLRLGLQAEVCDVSAVVCWADSIIIAERSPAFAFIELSICGLQPISTVVSLLSEVPGQSTPELPPKMLLGYCSELTRLVTHDANRVLVRLCFIAALESFPGPIANALSNYEVDLCLANDQIYGTPTKVIERFSNYLISFAAYARAISTGTV